MPLIVGLHYLVAFVLEMALLFSAGLFGFVRAGGGVPGAVLAAALVAAVIIVWARFAAPRSATRLKGMRLLIFKLAIFAAGALAFWAAGWTDVAIVFGLVAAVDLAVATMLHRL